MKTLAIIGTNDLPAKYGGFETLTNYLAANFDKTTHNVIVYCSKNPKQNRLKSYNEVKLIYFSFNANGWQSMIYDFRFLAVFAFPLNKVFKRNIIFNIGGIEWKKARGSEFTTKLETVLKK